MRLEGIALQRAEAEWGASGSSARRGHLVDGGVLIAGERNAVVFFLSHFPEVERFYSRAGRIIRTGA